MTKRLKTQAFFAPLSSSLTAEAQGRLDALAREAKRHALRTIVVGFVQETRSTNNEASLSALRARAVADYLRSKGLKGRFNVRGRGIAGPDGSARRVNVTVTYRVGC